MEAYYNNRQRLSQADKNKDDKQWYKDQANLLDNHSFSENNFIGFGGITEYKRKKVNYDLFNNIINIKDFEYVCQPFGGESGELPANFTNRDIVSGKIKVLLGMEMKMPFSWKVAAINEEATTRKEQEEFKKIQDFVIEEIMKPIKVELAKQIRQQQLQAKAQQSQQPSQEGQQPNPQAQQPSQLTPQEEQQIQEQVEKESQAKTPDEVRMYMVREHQDPAEMLAHQLLEYLIQKERVNDKFNKGFKHSLLAGEEIYWVGVLNGEPSMKVVNNLFFDYDKSPDLDYIEDGEWAVCEYRMTPSEVIANLGSEMTEEEVDKVYAFHQNNPSNIQNADFSFQVDKTNSSYTVRVLHCTWKSLRKIGFLTYTDEQGQEQQQLVDENYRLNKSAGDIKIDWDWIPETHECYKVLHDIYVYARPVIGQYKDLDNLYTCKLPYYGAACDNLNSPVTAPMDRMKGYQYFYDVILYRVELLMASDKGKILAANINAIPKSAGLDVSKFMYFMEANKIAWFNPAEEGNRGGGAGDVTNLVKEIDMSLASDINKYIQMAEYIERKCGESVGITKQMEGSIGPNEAVTNTRQNLVQSSHIIQPYFELHNIVKGNVLQALLETAKVAYSQNKPKKLNYILDDMSLKMLTLDSDLLDNSTYGLFVSNSSKAADAKQAVESLAQAALQNQQADLTDIIKVIRSESITEAEELLESAQARKAQQAQVSQEAAQQHEKELQAQQQQHEQAVWGHDKEMIILKEEERRKTEIQKQAMLSMGFDPNKDQDNDGTPDVLEVAKFGVDADIKAKRLQLDQDKLDQKTTHDEQKLKLEQQKIKQQMASKNTKK